MSALEYFQLFAIGFAIGAGLAPVWMILGAWIASRR